MRPRAIFVVDIIRDIVAKTNTAVIAELQAFNSFIQGINFVPGTEGEINEVLTIMSQQSGSDGKQWPLFGLIMSFPENKAQTMGTDNTVELNLIIARRGNNTDKTPARYDNNFRPVLYPIYLEFLNQIAMDKRFMTKGVDNMPHTKIDFPYYDADKGVNIFNSYVDAIQIKIKLKILLANC
jgi:hypothetical protein